MNLRTIQILAAITAPVTLAAILWPAPGSSISRKQAGAAILPALKAGYGDVTTLTITGAGSTAKLRYAHTGGNEAAGWVLTDKSDYPVQQATLRPVLDNMRAMRGVEPKTARPALYSRLGLDDPAANGTSHEIALANAKNVVVAAVILGRTKPDAGAGGTERQYVRVPGVPLSWLAEPSVSVPESALAWIDHSIIDIGADQIKRVVITQSGGAKLELSRAKPGDKLAVQNVPSGSKLKSDDPGSDVAGAIAALELTDVKAARAAPASTAATAHYETFDGLTADLTMWKQDGANWVTLVVGGSGKSTKAAYDIAARTDGWAYAISDQRAATLQTKMADLLAPAAAPMPAKK